MDLLDSNKDQLMTLCKKHKVNKLFAFGSIVTDKFDHDSDIDLIVDFKEVDLHEYADNYFDLKYSFEQIFKREVDLLEAKAINNPFLKKSIEAKKKLIYG